MAEKNKILNFINISYVIGTLLVVFGHSFPTNLDLISSTMFEIRGFVYVFHMPLFFFISGFLMKYTDAISQKGIAKYIKSRAIQLLAPYLVLTTLFYLPKNYLMGDEISIRGFVENIICPRLNIWGHFWYLPTLFFISCIFSVVFSLAKNLKSKAFYYALGIILFVLSALRTNIKLFAVSDILKFSFYYFLGYVLVEFVFENEAKIKKPLFLIASFIFSVVFYILKRKVFIKYAITEETAGLIIAVVMILFIFGISMHFTNKLAGLSKYSYTVYLYSWLFQTVILYLGMNMLHLPNYIVCPCMFIVGTLGPIIISIVYSKLKFINNKFLDIILGVKVKKNDK